MVHWGDDFHSLEAIHTNKVHSLAVAHHTVLRSLAVVHYCLYEQFHLCCCLALLTSALFLFVLLHFQHVLLTTTMLTITNSARKQAKTNELAMHRGVVKNNIQRKVEHGAVVLVALSVLVELSMCGEYWSLVSSDHLSLNRVFLRGSLLCIYNKVLIPSIVPP